MVEIIDWSVKDECESYNFLGELFDNAKVFAQYPWREYRVIRANTTNRKCYWFLYGILRYAGVNFDYLALLDEEIDWFHVINTHEVLAVDIDNTLILWDSDKWYPNHKVINYVNDRYDNGSLIVIWTARSSTYWNETRKLLNKIGVKYDFLVMDKLFANKYIDDIPVIHPSEIEK